MDAMLITNPDEIDIKPDTWNELINNCHVNTIFQTFEWFMSCWMTFGTKSSLFFIKVTDENELVGIAPLSITKTRNGKKILHFIGDNNSDYLDFIVKENKPEILLCMCKIINNNKPMWDKAIFNNIPDDSPTLSHLQTILSDLKLPSLKTGWVSCPALTFDESDYNNSKPATKKSLKRSFNRLSKLGKIEVIDFTSTNDIECRLDNFYDQHIRRWKDSDNKSLFNQSLNRDLFRNITQCFRNRKGLLFTEVLLDSQVIAYHFGFDYNNKVIWYKPSFDIKMKKYSPGLLLIKHLIEYCLINHKLELDFTIGDEEFKRRYSNTSRTNTYLTVYNSRISYNFNRALFTGRRLLKSILRV